MINITTDMMYSPTLWRKLLIFLILSRLNSVGFFKAKCNSLSLFFCASYQSQYIELSLVEKNVSKRNC